MDQPSGRQLLAKRAETMHPIFDTDTEGSPLDSRTSLEDEGGGNLGFQLAKDTDFDAVGVKNGKRSKGMEKLCRSLKKRERSSTSS